MLAALKSQKCLKSLQFFEMEVYPEVKQNRTTVVSAFSFCWIFVKSLLHGEEKASSDSFDNEYSEDMNQLLVGNTTCQAGER